MQQVAETMQGTAAQASCDFSFHPSPDAGAHRRKLRSSPDRAGRDEPLSNAFKYGAGRPVTLCLGRDGDQAVVEVRDHGPGIPPGDLDRIFERFERATTLQNHGGLGLGLYVSREIAQAHGGSIAARTLPDGGACFTVRLPLV